MRSAIELDGIGKRYRIGTARERHDTLRDALAAAFKAPIRNLRHLRRLTSFDGEAEERDDIVWALRDVSFDVPEGQVLGVIGRNGAGKSTLLKVLSRITEPTTGRAIMRGKAGALLEVGTGFHPELTGHENVFLNGAVLGMDRGYIEKHFDEIVEFAEVEKFIDTPIKRYSSGMKVRLAFAVAAHLQPEVLIIDEVLSVGDVGFQKKCLGKMETVAQSGRTVLFVSHNMGAVKSLCDRCLLLEAGRVVADGEPEPVVEEYLTRFERDREGRARVEADREGGWIRGRGEGYFLELPEDAQTEIRCGDPLRLSFAVEAPRELPEATVGITLSRTTGEMVVSMSSKVQNVPSAPGPAHRWSVACDMGEIPLNAGRYVVTVYVGDDEGDLARFSDAMTLTVHEHDVFGWGNRLPSQKDWGSMYWAPEWDIQPAS